MLKDSRAIVLYHPIACVVFCNDVIITMAVLV